MHFQGTETLLLLRMQTMQETYAIVYLPYLINYDLTKIQGFHLILPHNVYTFSISKALMLLFCNLSVFTYLWIFTSLITSLTLSHQYVPFYTVLYVLWASSLYTLRYNTCFGSPAFDLHD